MKNANDPSCPEKGNNADNMVWETFQNRFSQVQDILDQNRILIREINQNHESKIPENLTKNVTLIKELNYNISRVVELYADLSNEFVQSMMDATMDVNEGEQKSEKDTDISNIGQKRARNA